MNLKMSLRKLRAQLKKKNNCKKSIYILKTLYTSSLLFFSYHLKKKMKIENNKKKLKLI